MERRKAVILSIGASAMTGVIYACIILFEIGVAQGWNQIRNDPCKFVFHLLLLPLAFGALVAAFPSAAARRLWSRRGVRRAGFVLFGATVFILAAAVGLNDAVTGFQKRLPYPTNIRASLADQGPGANAREVVQASWAKLHDPNWTPDPLPKDDGPPFTAQRRAAFEQVLAQELGTPRRFWSQSSLAAWWAAFLTMTGAWLASMWLIVLLIALVERDSLDEAAVAALVVAFGTSLLSVAIWTYIKIYSEWYINFFAVPQASLPPLLTALGAAAFLTLAGIVLRSARRPLTWFAGILSVVGLISGFFAFWKPEVLQKTADAYRSADDPSVLSLWVVAAFTVFVPMFLTHGAISGPPTPGSGQEIPIQDTSSIKRG